MRNQPTKVELFRLIDRLQDATLRVEADQGSLVAVLAYDADGRTDGLPIYMQKSGLKPASEPPDRHGVESWGDPFHQYYRGDEVRLIGEFSEWVMMVRENETIFPTYVLVDFGKEDEKCVFLARSMSWFIHPVHLKRVKPKVAAG